LHFRAALPYVLSQSCRFWNRVVSLQALKLDWDEWQKGDKTVELRVRQALELRGLLPDATNMTL
jgi:hypothetical protein